MNNYTSSSTFPHTKNLPRASGIYIIRCLPSGKIYVGSAVNLRQRAKHHNKALNEHKHHNRYLQSAWNKYGETSFCFEVVELCQKEELLSLEQHWLDNSHCCDRTIGFNIAMSSTSPMLGRSPSPESVAKSAAARRGKIVSAETRAKIGAAHRGKSISLEHRQKVAEANRGNKYLLGRTASPETRQKQSAAKKGKPSPNLGKKFSPEHCANIGKSKKGKQSRLGSSNSPEVLAIVAYKIAKDYIVISPNGNTYNVHNMAEFSRKYNLNSSHMIQVALGNKPSHKGWVCRYA